MEHSPGPGAAADHSTPTVYWEGHYGQRDRVWSGNPNQTLVRWAEDLPPGTALDLGCGEGADAIWLASRGWRVTAVDVSTVALDRGRRAAEVAGVGDQIDWQQHDLSRSFADGLFDLVSAQFLHSPVELPRIEILRRAAAAVAPGGSLLVVGHAGFPPWSADHHTDMHFDTPTEVRDGLQLAPDEWVTVVADDVAREATGPDGQVATLVDSILLVRRAPAGERFGGAGS